MKRWRRPCLRSALLLCFSSAVMKTKTPSPQAKLPERQPERKDISQYCPQCAIELQGHHCKLLCPRCGYYMSCSDFY